LERYRKAIAISDQLVSEDAQRVEARRDLAEMYKGRAAAFKTDRKTAAVKNLTRAESLSEQPATGDPQNARVQKQRTSIPAVLDR
jgi:hypothetical protein